MKTYIGFAKENKGFRMVAIEATSINEAHNLFKIKGYKCSKSAIVISAVNIEYVECYKVL